MKIQYFDFRQDGLKVPREKTIMFSLGTLPNSNQFFMTLLYNVLFDIFYGLLCKFDQILVKYM